MGFINALAGATQGSVDYQKFMQQQAMQRQEQQMNAMKMQAFQQQQEQAQQDRASQENVARGMVGTQGMFNPVSIPPMPGQASQPQQQQQQQPQQQSPDGLDASKVDPRMMAYLAKQNPQALQKGLSHFQQTSQQPQIPPYQTMGGQQPQAQQQPAQIPEQPKYDWDTMVKKLESMGITRPSEQMAVMEKQQSRMDTEAKQKLAYYKEMEMTMYRERMAGAAEKRAATGEKAEGARESLIPSQIGKNEATAGAANTRAAGATSADTGGADAIDAAAWDRIITGHEPPSRGGIYSKVMGRVASIAKENGMTTQELMTSSADVKTKLSAKKNFEVRAQNMQRAENNLDAEIPVFQDAVKAVGTFATPAFAKAALAVRRQMGDPLVTKMDQSADVVFREFEAVVNGNLGSLNVQDVTNAHEAYMKAQTPQQAEAAIQGMRRIIKNAAGAMDKTRDEIIGGVTRQLSGKNAKPAEGGIPSGWSVKEH